MKIDGDVLQVALSVLESGGIVMHPTETSYGLAVDVFNESALNRLYEVKGMSFDKPVSVMVCDLSMAEKYGKFNKKARELAEKFWPGPLTIIVPRKDSLPAFLNKGSRTIALRMTPNDFTLSLVKKFGRPFTTTSANKTGESPLYFPEKFSGVDFIVDAGVLPENKASTIAKVEGNDVVVLREGEIVLGEHS